MYISLRKLDTCLGSLIALINEATIELQAFTKKILDTVRTGIFFTSTLDLKQKLITGAYVLFALS